MSEIFAGRTREQWRAFASEHDCCLEPVLDLDEALDSELVAAREMVVELDQPGASAPFGCSECRSSSAARPAIPTRAPGPALGEHTDEVLAEAGFTSEQIEELHDGGAVAGAAAGVQGSFMRG